jgi:hypothetical protein
MTLVGLDATIACAEVLFRGAIGESSFAFETPLLPQKAVPSYYKYCRKIKRFTGQGKLEDAFLWAFATTYMAKEESFWFEDTDVSAEVEKIVKDLYDLLAKDSSPPQ